MCSFSCTDHPILKLLKGLMFNHNVNQPSHRDGNVIDYASHYSPDNSIENINVMQLGQYFTDHDLLVVDISELLKEES